jgi:fatty acid desaturase
MSLRSDVIHELATLDSSSRALRRFGLLVGGAFALLTALGVWRHWPPPAVILLGVPALLLISLGAVAPAGLRSVHRAWMTFALALGWCMSRLILALVFGLAVVPLALLGRLFRLPFTKIRHAAPQESYWVDHASRARQHHTDMF